MDHRDPKQEIVIAGAGCAGLAAGINLLNRGHSVTILEDLDRVGGLAGGIEIGGNIYEYGPHIFHTTDPEVLDQVQRIAGHVLIPFQRSIKIKFLGKFFDYPLSFKDMFKNLPIMTVIHAFLSFIWHFLFGFLRGKGGLTNSEKVLQRYYGDVVYRLFFKDYIFKVWGCSPSDMSASFAEQRIPQFDFWKPFHWIYGFIAKKKKREISAKGYIERVEGQFFTTKKGFFLICEAFADEFCRRGGVLELNSKVVKIHTENNSCCGVEYQAKGIQLRKNCNIFISTIPINLLPEMLDPKPPMEIFSHSEKLRFRGILFIGLLIKRKPILPASFMYFRDKTFNRITDLSYFHIEIEPLDATILIAEITCQPEEISEHEASLISETVVEELLAEGLITRNDVLEKNSYKIKHGYPIYSVGYENHLEHLENFLAQYRGIYSIGRQGSFSYHNTHVSMKMGMDLGENL
jgi:protoporphyrinogen oxidase